MKRNFESKLNENDFVNKKVSKNTDRSLKSVKSIFNQFIIAKAGTLDCLYNKEEVCDLLCKYWLSLEKLDGDSYKCSSLLTHRQLLRTILLDYGYDIIYDSNFSKSNTIFTNYLSSLKEKGLGSVKHFDDISREDLRSIVSTLNPLNIVELQLLAWFYVMLFFCQRGQEYVVKMVKTDIIFDSENGKTTIRLKNSITKNHTEIDEDDDNGGILVEEPNSEKCPVKVLKTYLSFLHPDNIYLWQRHSPKISHAGYHFTLQKLGANKIGSMMKTISQICNLSKIYTNHCIRTSCCTLMSEICRLWRHRNKKCVKA